MHVCWWSYQLFPGLCFQCYCYGTTSLLCINLVPACIICTCSIGECAALCAVTTVTELWHLCWLLPPMDSDMLLHLLPWWSSSDGTSLDNAVCQGPLTLCCYTTALHWINLCSWIQWGTMLCCPECHLTHSSCHLIPRIGQPLGWYQRHLSPDIGDLMFHRISCMNHAWLCSWLCHITPNTCCCMTILSLLM